MRGESLERDLNCERHLECLVHIVQIPDLRVIQHSIGRRNVYSILNLGK
jgi:hypothetical protein